VIAGAPGVTAYQQSKASSPIQGAAGTAAARVDLALVGSGGSSGAHGYDNEGKSIAAAFLDNYRKIVAVVHGDSSLQRDIGTLQEEAANGGRAPAGVVFNEGDVVAMKISNIKLLAAPAHGAQTVATIDRGAELVIIGGEQNGFVDAQGSTASGWARSALMMLR
jgi:hypothetical protein